MHDEFIEESIDGLTELSESLEGTTVEDAAAQSGVSADDLRWAARIIGTSAPAAFMYGVRENDPPGLATLIASIASVTGNVANAQGGGLHILRPGGGNVQGVLDILGSDAASLDEIIDGIESGAVTALYWTGDIPENIGESGRARLLAALGRLEFLVLQGLVIDDELAALANVLIPAAAAVEREVLDVQAVGLCRPGDAQPVWHAPVEIARRLGASGFDYENADAILADIAATVPNYAGITAEVLDSRVTGPTWPLRDDAADERLYQGGTFGNASGRIRLAAV